MTATALSIVQILLSIVLASEGPLSAGTGVNVSSGGNAWSGENRIVSSNDDHASCSLGAFQQSDQLDAKDFGFAIPSGATIDGIVAEIERSASTDAFDDYVLLLKAGTPIGSNKADSNNWSGPDTYITYGGSADTWGESWDDATINDPDFGVSVAATNYDFGAATLIIDHVRITVYYTTAGGGPTSASSLLLLGGE